MDSSLGGYKNEKWRDGGDRVRNGEGMEGSYKDLKWIWLAVRWLAKLRVFNLSLTSWNG